MTSMVSFSPPRSVPLMARSGTAKAPLLPSSSLHIMIPLRASSHCTISLACALPNHVFPFGTARHSRFGLQNREHLEHTFTRPAESIQHSPFDRMAFRSVLLYRSICEHSPFILPHTTTLHPDLTKGYVPGLDASRNMHPCNSPSMNMPITGDHITCDCPSPPSSCSPVGTVLASLRSIPSWF
ncbi:hypothetical protein J3A83DRAFT_45280 [Scleroderma citrinum]